MYSLFLERKKEVTEQLEIIRGEILRISNDNINLPDIHSDFAEDLTPFPLKVP